MVIGKFEIDNVSSKKVSGDLIEVVSITVNTQIGWPTTLHVNVLLPTSFNIIYLQNYNVYNYNKFVRT